MSELRADPPAAEHGVRGRVVATAVRLFADQGFAATSIKQIAREAGVSQGAMYTYFASKDDLLREIFGQGMEDVAATLASAGSADDPLQGIERLVQESFRLVAEHAARWRLIYALRTQPAVVERLGIELDGLAERIERELAKLCTRAGIVEPEIEARILFAFIDGANQHRMSSRRSYPVERVIEALMARYRVQQERRA